MPTDKQYSFSAGLQWLRQTFQITFHQENPFHVKYFNIGQDFEWNSKSQLSQQFNTILCNIVFQVT